MTTIDPNSDLGKVRLRIGDWGDVATLPDQMILSALLECSDNIKQASVLCATYILAILSQRTHKKLQMLELWGNQTFEQYQKYLIMIAKDPYFNGLCPLAYTGNLDVVHPLIEFVEHQNEPNTIGKL